MIEDSLKKLLIIVSGCKLKSVIMYEINLIEFIIIREGSDLVKFELFCVVWIDRENIVVVDRGNEKIKLFELNGKFIKFIYMLGVVIIFISILVIVCWLVDLCMKIFRLLFIEIKIDVGV